MSSLLDKIVRRRKAQASKGRRDRFLSRASGRHFERLEDRMVLTGDLVLTGVIDGPLTGGLPKAIELYALDDIADLSAYGVGSANNGGGSDGEEFAFPAVGASAGDYLYVATESIQFTNFFGFAPTFIDGTAPNINGDDAIELFMNGSVVDVFGEINVDGTGQPWEHTDGWAYRVNSTGPDGNTFVLGNWTFSGIDALEGETTNANAATPFPAGSFTSSGGSFDLQITEIWSGQDGADLTVDWFEITNVGAAPWVSGVGPDLFYDDESADPDDAVQIQGIAQIAPGQSAIVLLDGPGDGSEATNFFNAWNPDKDLTGVPIGFTGAAAGLGDGGDAVTLWRGDPNAGGILADMEAYPSAPSGVSFDVALSTFSTVGNASGAVQTTATAGSSGTEPAIGSPGMTGSSSSITPIFEIQGAAHASSFNGQTVTTTGIVTAVGGNGFYMQAPTGDGEDDTSDGIFVFTSSAPTVAVGDDVEVTGDVSEFGFSGELTTTRIGGLLTVNVNSSGNALPAPVVIGAAGRTPPTEVIDDDSLGSFDPANDGIDFYESLEAMLVEVQSAVVVGPNRFGEITVLADNGTGATNRTARGGIHVDPNDFNPERIIIDNGLSGLSDDLVPPANVGDSFAGPVQGVIGYSFGNFKLLNPDPLPAIVDGGLQPEVTSLTTTSDKLTVATFNVLNLDPNDVDGDQDVAGGQFDSLASQIVNNLQSPDIIALQEIQDNTGSADDGVTPADQTFQTLINAIVTAGGPAYEFREIAPNDNADGGQPGANIRVGYLFNPARVSFIDRGAGGPDDASLVNSGPELSLNPGRVDPTNPAFNDSDGAGPFEDSRKSLAAEFEFDGQKVYLINNHFKSKSGDDSLFGATQPPVEVTVPQRDAQAAVIRQFVDDILAQDTSAKVIVLGDLNDFDFSTPLRTLTAGTLTNLVDSVPEDDRYSFVFDGNSQTLDHILVSPSLLSHGEVDIVHVNAEFAPANRSSDHDPVLARFDFDQPSSAFTLQLLHASDLEGGIDAIDDAPNFAAVVEGLEQEAARLGLSSLLLSAGDNYIPGPFFNAAADPAMQPVLQAFYEDFFGLPPGSLPNIAQGPGRVDISIMNAIGFDASAVGNHEFDAGSATLGSIIAADPLSLPLPPPAAVVWPGAQFPYLSANLDFSGDANLSPISSSNIPRPTDSFVNLVPAMVVEAGGEQIGVVGATTQLLETISSPGDTAVIGGPFPANDMPQLASVLQPVIDAMIGTGINKIILVSHLQQIALETTLAGLLSGIDIIVAGGSDTLLADFTDQLRPGDTADDVYPRAVVNADDDPTLIVSTDGQYSYVGRLVVGFDAAGVILPATLDPLVNGAYATDDEGVINVWGNLADPFAPGTKGEDVRLLTQAVAGVVAANDVLHGFSGVFLEGRREAVRTEETNLGNLTADANLATAKAIDPAVQVSLKNGGGIRAPIGEVDPISGELMPNSAKPLLGHPAGEVSQIDVEDALRFNNELSLVTVTAAGLLQLIEHGVAATAPAATPGQFPQIGGMAFSFDGTRPSGSRVQSLAIIDELGNVLDTIAENGAVVGDLNRPIRIVTLTFLAGGGDGYPFPAVGSNRLDTGIGEQQALIDFFSANHAAVPYYTQDTPIHADRRIQNLEFRHDTVLSEVASNELSLENLGSLNIPGAEINAFHPGSARVFVTTGAGVQVVDLSDPANPTLVGLIDPVANGASASAVTSIAINGDLLAAAVPNANKTDNGDVFFYDPNTLAFLGSVEVGALPDMLTFTRDGAKLLVANEGESAGGDNEPLSAPNPPGSVSVIDIELADLSLSSVTPVTFDAFDGSGALPPEVRIFPGLTPSVDIEPEYISVSPDGMKAFVTLQENNAVAVLDLATNTFSEILPLGTKDHTLPYNKLDPSNEDGPGGDGAISIQNAPVHGLFMPDAIASYEVGGVKYFVTANEGDSRAVDETRIKDYGEAGEPMLDPSAGLLDADILPTLQDDAVLGRLISSNVNGDTDGDGDIDKIHVFGGRSFSIFDEFGNLVHDSGDLIARVTAMRTPTLFNANDGDPGEFDQRSDDKGAEPEGVVLVSLGGEMYAFVGLERSGGGVMIFNVSDPWQVRFVDYFRVEGDVAPEGLTFVPRENSPNGMPLLLITNEESGNLRVLSLTRSADIAPQLIELRARYGNGQSYDLLNGSRERLPWQITAIEATFSEPVQGSINSLVRTNGALVVAGFSGNGTDTLRWTLDAPLETAHVIVQFLADGPHGIRDLFGASLDGDGDGQIEAADHFFANFKVLYGDFNDDGFVSIADAVSIRHQMQQGHDPFADLDGDGDVDLDDMLIARRRIGQRML